MGDKLTNFIILVAATIALGMLLSGVVKAEPYNDGSVINTDVTATEFSQFVMDACRESGVVFLSTHDNGVDYILPIYCEWGVPYNPLEWLAPDPAEEDEDSTPEGTWL